MTNGSQQNHHKNDRRSFLKSLGITVSVAALESDTVVSKGSTQTTSESSNEWTTARSNSNRTGAIQGKGPAPFATTDWKLDLDGGMFYKEPIVANETIYLSLTTATTSNENQGKIAAYDKETGDLKWEQSDIPTSKTPTVDDKLLYVATSVPEDAESNNGGLFALDIDTGDVVWSRTDGLRWASPIVVNDRIFTSNENGAYALKRTTGETVWKSEDVNGLVDGSDSAVSYTDGTLFFSDGTALNAADGSIKWTITDDTSTFANHTISNGHVYYIRTEPVDGGDDTVSLEARSITTGMVEWEFEFEDKAVTDNRIAISEGRLIVFDSNEGDSVTALNSKTGDQLWTQELVGEFFSNPTVTDGTIFLGGRYMLPSRPGEGKAIVYAIDLISGDIKWAHLLDTDTLETSPEEPPAAGVPVLTDGEIYLITYPAGSMFEYEYIFYSNLFVLGASETKSNEVRELYNT